MKKSLSLLSLLVAIPMANAKIDTNTISEVASKANEIVERQHSLMLPKCTPHQNYNKLIKVKQKDGAQLCHAQARLKPISDAGLLPTNHS